MLDKAELEELMEYVRLGGDLKRFTKNEILKYQDYALVIKDIDLYDKLQGYWDLYDGTTK